MSSSIYNTETNVPNGTVSSSASTVIIKKDHNREKSSVSTTSQMSGNANGVHALVKKATAPSFKVEAEIVNTNTLKTVMLFDNNDHLLAMSNVNLDAPSNDANDVSASIQQASVDNASTIDKSDSEETFVYDKQQIVEPVYNDESRSLIDVDRPILIHKNSIRSTFRTNNINNLQPRAFSQTLMADNESTTSKKIMNQQRISTIQQQPPLQQQQIPQILQQIQAPVGRYNSKQALYQASISSRSHTYLPHLSLHPEPTGVAAHTNSDDSDQGSFMSGKYSRSDTERGAETEDGDYTNSTFKLNVYPIASPLKSFSDPTLLMNNNARSPNRSPNAKNLITSQVRNVSKTLFEKEKNYLPKKLSFGSLKELDERSLLLHNHEHQDSGDEDYGYSSTRKNHNGILRNEDIYDHWNVDYSLHGNGTNKHAMRNHSSLSASNDFYHYPTYDSTNPHNYVSKYRKQNFCLKLLSMMLKILLFLILATSMCKLFAMRFITNPILNFEVVGVEKLIITDNLLIFDVVCSCTNINLQDVNIDESDVDIFISYSSVGTGTTEKTILLGNITTFFVPLKFSGSLNNANIPLRKIFNASYVRQAKMTSNGQLKLTGEFGDLYQDIDEIINKPFTLDIRGSFKYKLPFSSSDNLISVSKKYKHKEL